MNITTKIKEIEEAKAEIIPAGTPTDNLPAIADPQHGMPRTGISKIAAAISSVMGEIGIIAKDGVNQFHRYRYAQMQDILQQLTPLLAKHGLMIVQTEVGRAMFDDDRAVSVQYRFTIAHSSGEIWPEHPLQTGLSRCRDSKGGFDDKALNKCHTAARKYFLLALFQIPTGDADDADSGSNDGSERRPPRPAPNMMRSLDETTNLPPTRDDAADQAAPPAEVQASTAQVGAAEVLDESPTERFSRLDRELGIAATKGTAELQKAWKSLRPEDQATLKAALDRRHKRTAKTVDEAMEK